MFHHAKKSLGQNFLKSERALFKICEAGSLSQGDVVLEIGPGKGALTKKLLEKGAQVVAVEKDDSLVVLLNEIFEKEIKEGQLKLINEDILDFEIPKKIGSYKIIANIPYNITGAIFKKFLEEERQPERMVLLVQKEVAKRIMAQDGKESILSISIKAYGTPKYLMTVGKKLFSPSPKVDSAIILISNISKDNFKNKSFEKIFFEVLKAGFAHKRKMLLGNLSAHFAQKEKVEGIFDDLQIGRKIRAENLKVEEWIHIAKELY